MDEAIGVYIHLPFCARKCAYCDFTSFAGEEARIEEYVKTVCREARAQAALFGRRLVATIYLGGGTPSLLTGAQARALLDALRACFDVAPDAEITMEANPGTLTPAKLCAYREAGVNRLSLGVQSLDDGLLAAIGRIHTAAQAREAARMAREAGFGNVNLDLMAGLPGQTPRLWEETLAEAASLPCAHLSCYALIVEEGTPLAARVASGACALPDEDALAEMDEITERIARRAGFARYEVSNYARPGFACRHNLTYWECRPYLGLGLAAHSDMDGRRFYNASDWAAYARQACGAQPREAEGDGSAAERRFERLMMGLRMLRGVDEARFHRDFGGAVADFYPKTVREMTALGMLEREGGYMRLTARGMQVMNAVLVAFLQENS